jgi:hypothetical protein
VRDLDGLRGLIAERLGKLEPAAAPEWLWRFMDTARPVALGERRGAVPGWVTLIRHLADVAGDIEAFRSTIPPKP